MELRPSASWLPARALASSSLLHIGVGMVWILLLPALGLLLPSPRIARVPIEMKRASVTLTLTLPPLGAPTRGSGRPAAAGPSARGAASASPPASATTGFVFLGPQPIVSLPPRPDNLMQTVRQPDLPNPPKLTMRVAAPNILQMAAPAPVLAPQPAVMDTKARANAGESIPLQPRPSDAVPVPKLSLPASGDQASKSVGALMASAATTPELAQPPPQVSGEGSDRRNLLVLNAMPARELITPIPPGERAGAFSVSPEGNSGTRAGTATDNAPGAGVNGKGATGTGSGNATSPGGGPGAGSSSSGKENSGGATAGNGSGTGPGNAGRGPGGGTGTGTGAGPADRGSGNASISGGAGGPGNATFPGVSIGGTTPAISAANAPARIPTSRGTYSMTIVATGASGGGVGDFGIFKNEVAYTVYLDVAEPGHARPKWTLQYASATSQANSNNVVAPFPTSKEYPHLPEQALARNIGRKLVVTGLITKEGKFDSLRVLQSPNPLLIKPLLDCLAQWTFQAAEAGGEQVAVRFVLAIPITAELLNAH